MAEAETKIGDRSMGPEVGVHGVNRPENGVQRPSCVVHFLSARRDFDTSTGLEATDGSGDAPEAQAAWN